MSLAVWREEYITGNAEVDRQHQQLFEIINHLHDAMMVGKGKQMLKATLDELVKYTVIHFQTEEALMVTYHYPEYKTHKQIHDELTAEVLALVKNFDHPSTVLTIEVSRFLTSWLIHHIRGEDQKMIKFLRDKLNPASS